MSIEVQPPMWAHILIREHNNGSCNCNRTMNEKSMCLAAQLLEGHTTIDELSTEKLS